MAKILVVDDQRAIRSMFKAILATTPHETDFAEDGAIAYNAAKGITYDLILADMMMPNMDGVELTQKLRQLSKYHQTPIYIVSSSTSDEKKAQAREAGANGWVLKPVTPERVLKLVGKTIGL